MKGHWLALWVDPAGKIYPVSSTHHGWIYENRELLVDEYNIDTEQHYLDRLERFEREIYSELYNERINDRANQLDIDPSQVELTEKDTEEISVWANEAARDQADHGWDLETVDLLIQNKWIRVAQRSAIVFEGDSTANDFYGRCEDVLIERFPDVWKNSQTSIVVNDQQIYAADLREYGSLRKALQAARRTTNYHMMWR